MTNVEHSYGRAFLLCFPPFLSIPFHSDLDWTHLTVESLPFLPSRSHSPYTHYLTTNGLSFFFPFLWFLLLSFLSGLSFGGSFSSAFLYFFFPFVPFSSHFTFSSFSDLSLLSIPTRTRAMYIEERVYRCMYRRTFLI